MPNSTRFLDAFAKVEKLLRAVSGSDRQMSFYQIVDAAAARAPGVRRYRDDLKEFADLRNAIVHERSDGHAIAEPHDRVVSDLQRLASILADPPKVLPSFQKNVHTVELADVISEILRYFSPKNFSQVPVVSSGRIVGLLTSNTVSRWLASEVRHEVVDLTGHTVADAMKHTEHDGNWSIVPRATSLVDVVNAFDAAESAGKRLDAILITQSGKASEGLLGIITIHDMPRVLRAVTLSGKRA